MSETIPSPEDVPHRGELPPFNGDRVADWATDDDGQLYKVVCGDRFPKTGFVPLERTREYVLPRRDAVGEDCATCGEEIGPFAIILIDSDGRNHHLGCYETEL